MLIRIPMAVVVLGAALGGQTWAQEQRCGTTLDRQNHTEIAHLPSSALEAARSDEQLGELCESAGMYVQAEAALRRAIELYPTEAILERLSARNNLATLLASIGEEKQAEQEDRIALVEAEKVGDAGAASLAWTNFADAEALQKHFGKAIEYSRRAVLIDETATSEPLVNRMLAKQALGFALAGNHQCAEAIPLLEEVLTLSKGSYGEQSGEAGISQFVLGEVAGRCGDSADAAAWMQQGILRMKATLGASHMGYLHAVSEYAQFLRENGRLEEAVIAEREVRMANTTVDARTLAPLASLR